MLKLFDQFGGWPILHDKWEEFPDTQENYLAKVLNTTGIVSIIMELSVGFDPLNSSQTVIELDQPKFEYNLPYLADNDNPVKEEYTQLITQIARQMSMFLLICSFFNVD